MTAIDSLSASLEDYLETIFHIVTEKQVARAKDITRRLTVSGASVTGALRVLADKKLIKYAPYDVITLTPRGKTVAKDIIRRHEALRDFFVKVLAVDESEAEEAACKMEHSIPRKILDRLIQYIEFVEICPRGGTNWINEFGYYCDHGGTMENCEQCIFRCLEDIKKRKSGKNVKRK